MMRWRDQSGPTRTPRSEGSVAAEGSKRPRVAVLVDSLRNSYQTTIIAGLSDAAARREVDLVVFAGGVLGAPGHVGVNRNFGFDLCDPAAFEGAVILGGALGNELGQSAIAAVCARFGALPLVSVAASAPGVPTLAVDEESGMRQALDHLVARHGFRRIAFVRGPTVNPEAERRFGVYRAVLEERGIGFDADLVCVGTFERAAGEAAVATLIDDRKLDFDALVAANDYMALGAIPALEARGLQVPSDVAVVGFDDVEDARFSTPPLTTVRQPLYQQGEAALDLVLAKLSGREIALETAAPTELVVRQSCGCLSGLARPGRAGPVTMTATCLRTSSPCSASSVSMRVAVIVTGPARPGRASPDRQPQDWRTTSSVGAAVSSATSRPASRSSTRSSAASPCW